VPHWCPPDAESPFASLRCYLAEGNICCYLNRHCPVLIAHTGSWARPKSSPRLRLSLLRLVFAGCRQSLLENGPSRHYLRSLCMVAWTRTPQCSAGALARFFPADNGLTLEGRGSAHLDHPCNATSTRTAISGLQSFLYVQAPILARPPGCTHRCSLVAPERPGRLHHA
jgi:hypothetical protein